MVGVMAASTRAVSHAPVFSRLIAINAYDYFVIEENYARQEAAL
jgi:hypothetical protein